MNKLFAGLLFLLASLTATYAQDVGSRGAAANGKTVTAIGDSTALQGAVSNPAGSPFFFGSNYQVGTNGNSALGWLTAFSEGGIVLDPNASYPGSPAGLLRVIPITGGTCSFNSTLTFTPSAPTGSLPNQASAFTVQTNAAGAVTVGQVIPLATPGSGYTGSPTYTVAGGTCSTQPVFAYVLGGVLSYGVGGDNTAGLLGRLQYDTAGTPVCSNPPDFAILYIGTNDLTQGVAAQTVATNIQTAAQRLASCGIRVLIRGIASRNIAGSWTATQDLQRIWINRQSQLFAQRSRFAGNGLAIHYFDTDRYDTDATASGGSIGNPIAQATYDGLHQASWRGFVEGMLAWQILKPYAPQALLQPNSQSDVYDATNNPTGNLIGTAGLFVGTGGTVTPCTGTAATGWTISTAGTGSLTCSLSIESTQTNGQTGQRQVITFSNTGGGNAESVTLTSNAGIVPTASITRGTDRLSLSYNMDVSGMSGVYYAGGQIFENSSGTAGTGTCLYSVSQTGANFTLPPSTLLAKWSYAAALPDYGITGAGSFRFSCQSAPLLTQAAATSYVVIFRVQGTSSAGTFAGVLKLGNVAVRKVN